MTGKHIFTSEQKLEWWGHGEWVEEIDILEWEFKNVKCKVFRMAANDAVKNDGTAHIFGGYFNGYIQVPDNHPWKEMDPFEIDADVHGGITFGKKDEKNGQYWIGFDCAHLNDILPSMELIKKTFPQLQFSKDLEEMKKRFPVSLLFNPSYKNINYVKYECESLVDQMLAIKVQ